MYLFFSYSFTPQFSFFSCLNASSRTILKSVGNIISTCLIQDFISKVGEYSFYIFTLHLDSCTLNRSSAVLLLYRNLLGFHNYSLLVLLKVGSHVVFSSSKEVWLFLSLQSQNYFNFHLLLYVFSYFAFTLLIKPWILLWSLCSSIHFFGYFLHYCFKTIPVNFYSIFYYIQGLKSVV